MPLGSSDSYLSYAASMNDISPPLFRGAVGVNRIFTYHLLYLYQRNKRRPISMKPWLTSSTSMGRATYLEIIMQDPGRAAMVDRRNAFPQSPVIIWYLLRQATYMLQCVNSQDNPGPLVRLSQRQPGENRMRRARYLFLCHHYKLPNPPLSSIIISSSLSAAAAATYMYFTKCDQVRNIPYRQLPSAQVNTPKIVGRTILEMPTSSSPVKQETAGLS